DDEVSDDEYRQLRAMLLSDESLRAILPRFVVTCRDLGQFWSYIKYARATYQGRRELIWDAFRPLIDALEGISTASTPHDAEVGGVLARFDLEHVHTAWQKALHRRNDDPEGAITSARTLLESVCKHILDEARISYDNKYDLPRLYRLASEQLNLAPEQHQEQIFKQILGGCKSVVEGLGAIRNRLSDAHGKGSGSVKPSARHAALAVNLSGSMASFLVASWLERSKIGVV
ncbi:MAG: abortive infection family protein, partial [Bacteroidota bacterium]